MKDHMSKLGISISIGSWWLIVIHTYTITTVNSDWKTKSNSSQNAIMAIRASYREISSSNKTTRNESGKRRKKISHLVHCNFKYLVSCNVPTSLVVSMCYSSPTYLGWYPEAYWRVRGKNQVRARISYGFLLFLVWWVVESLVRRIL